jgi:nucleoside-diphosphate-sugar epimerase
MRIFLTGGTGYIGRALAARLCADGHEVRALVRSTSNTAPLAAIGALTFAGDITDRASMREGMSGAGLGDPRRAELSLAVSDGAISAANVLGSENVASLAYKLGVGRFLSVSSMGVVGRQCRRRIAERRDVAADATVPDALQRDEARRRAGHPAVGEARPCA